MDESTNPRISHDDASTSPSAFLPPPCAEDTMSSAQFFHSQRGRAIFMRPVHTEDRPSLASFLRNLSPQSYTQRYLLAPIERSDALIQSEVGRLFSQRTKPRILITAHLYEAHQNDVLALAELAIGETNPTIAEIALTVADAYQRDGIGSTLCHALMRHAQRECVTIVQGFALAHNTAIRRLVARLALPYSTETRRGITLFRWALG